MQRHTDSKNLVNSDYFFPLMSQYPRSPQGPKSCLPPVVGGEGHLNKVMNFDMGFFFDGVIKIFYGGSKIGICNFMGNENKNENQPSGDILLSKDNISQNGIMGENRGSHSLLLFSLFPLPSSLYLPFPFFSFFP